MNERSSRGRSLVDGRRRLVRGWMATRLSCPRTADAYPVSIGLRIGLLPSSSRRPLRRRTRPVGVRVYPGRPAPLSCGYRLSREPTIETTLKPHVMQIRLIKHEAVPQCGSYEVRFSDDRPSKYFYWDDVSSQRFRPEMLTGEQAAQKAKSFARAGRDEIG